MAGDNQQFCLRWNNHQSTLISVFDSLLESGTLVDCTLAAEGQYLKAHKVVLSACSPYLEALLSQHYEKHPIVILKDVKFQELKSMMDYMYRGEVNITQDQLATFLKAAESLQIKGLSESSGGDDARDVGSTAKRPREEPPPRRPVNPHPQARLPHSSGLTIEPRRSIPHSSEMAPESPMKSREGSTSPVARKRRRRRPSTGEDASNAALSDSQLETSNSCDLPPISNQAQSTPISVPSILATPSASNNQPIESDQPLETDAMNRFPNTPGGELMVKTKMEPNTDQLIEPKTEYLDDINNEDSVEDLTLDDDDEMPGPSHADGSNQNFSQWQMSGDRSTDEVFMAAQEAVGAHRDSQDRVSLKNIRAMLKSIQKTVIGNSTSLANLNQKVDALLAPDPSISAEVTEEDIEDILRRTLPIKNMEDFSALQEDLKVNQPLRKKLCSILKLAGGKDIKDTCQNMLRKLMLDDLAQKFTYKGKLAGKARFAGTEISDALNASIRAIIPGNISTDDKIKECVSEWLTQAKFREQKRERRKRNQEVQPFMELNMSQYPTLCRGQIDQDALVLQSMLDQINEPVDLDEN